MRILKHDFARLIADLQMPTRECIVRAVLLGTPIIASTMQKARVPVRDSQSRNIPNATPPFRLWL